ncbi:MAG: hypothetical protein QW403_02195 [Candidatus Aenigmatarchaeota archaeon]
MSIYEKESAIHRFEINIKLLSEDLDFLPEAISSFTELGEYFEDLKNREEYKRTEEILNSLGNPIKRIAHKLYMKDLNKCAGVLVATARKKVEELRKYHKPVEIKKEVIAVKIPPSPWYRVKENASKLFIQCEKSEKTIIRNLIPTLEDLITDLQELGAPKEFYENLNQYLKFLFSVEDPELTIDELEKLSPHYGIKNKQLRTLLTQIKHYSERKIEKEKREEVLE